MDKTTELKKILNAPVKHKNSAIIEHCEGRSVLDIGCIGQDNFLNNPQWLHKQIREKASEVIGVDIISQYKENLLKLGYIVISPEELPEIHKKFDVILLADVIEHVDNISDFLKFYRTFLKDDGKIIITTPNPFSIRRVISVFLYKEPGINPEHTCWFDPFTMLEIFNRQSFKIFTFNWLHEYLKPSKFRYRILYPIFRIIYSCRKYYAPNFMFVVSN